MTPGRDISRDDNIRCARAPTHFIFKKLAVIGREIEPAPAVLVAGSSRQQRRRSLELSREADGLFGCPPCCFAVLITISNRERNRRSAGRSQQRPRSGGQLARDLLRTSAVVGVQPEPHKLTTPDLHLLGGEWVSPAPTAPRRPSRASPAGLSPTSHRPEPVVAHASWIPDYCGSALPQVI
jgi:hypothetical protein